MAQEPTVPGQVKNEQLGHEDHASYHQPRAAEASERLPHQRLLPALSHDVLETPDTAMELAAIEILNPADASAAEQTPLVNYTQAEEAENILAVEAKEVGANELLFDDPEVVAAPALDETVAVDANVPAATDVKLSAEAEHKAGDPAQVNGQKVSIEQEFSSLDGIIVYSVTHNDNSKTLVYATELVFLDPVKEKALEAVRFKELFDRGSSFIKATHTFSHLGERWTDPQDTTINRGVNSSAPFEEQEAARMHNRTVYLMGVTIVFIHDLLVARNAPHAQPLFGIVATQLLAPVTQEVPVSVTPPLAAALEAHEPEPHSSPSHWFSKILR